MLRSKTIPGGGEGRWVGKKKLIYHTWGSNEPDYDANNPIVRGGQPVEEEEYFNDESSQQCRPIWTIAWETF
jgi:hypothetical protein